MNNKVVAVMGVGATSEGSFDLTDLSVAGGGY
jgi:hypothetical protein